VRPLFFSGRSAMRTGVYTRPVDRDRVLKSTIPPLIRVLHVSPTLHCS
jgi:hypothetical protein